MPSEQDQTKLNISAVGGDNIIYLPFEEGVSPITQSGRFEYQDNELVGFSLKGKNPLKIEVRIGVDFPIGFQDVPLDGPENLYTLWQPKILRKRRNMPGDDEPIRDEERLKTREMTLPKQDVNDFAIIPTGALTGITIEATGDLSLLNTLDKTFGPLTDRVVIDKKDPFRIRRGPINQTRQFLYSKSGLIASVRRDRLPLAHSDYVSPRGKNRIIELPFRFHKYTNPQTGEEKAIIQISGDILRTINESEDVQTEVNQLTTTGSHLLFVTILDATEHLILGETSEVSGYGSNDYVKKVAGKDLICPISGHEMNAQEQNFEELFKRRNDLVFESGTYQPAVQFRLATVSPSIAFNLELKGEYQVACSECMPAICHHVHNWLESSMICPGCQRIWSQDHFCPTPLGDYSPYTHAPQSIQRIFDLSDGLRNSRQFIDGTLP